MRTVPVKSAKEIKIKGKMEERTGWLGQKKNQIEGEVADLLVLPRPAKSLKNDVGFSSETWTYWAC